MKGEGELSAAAWQVRSLYGDQIVAGDIEAWLSERKAVPRRGGGYKIRGRVVYVSPLTRPMLERMARIIPDGAAAKALAFLESHR